MSDTQGIPSPEPTEEALLGRMAEHFANESSGIPDAEPEQTPQEALDESIETEQQASDEAEAADESDAQDSEPAEPTVELEHLGKKYVVPESLKKAFEANRTMANRPQAELVEMRKMLHFERQAIEAQRLMQEQTKAEFEELAKLESQMKQLASLDRTGWSMEQRFELFDAERKLQGELQRVRETLGQKQQQFTGQFRQQIEQAKQHGQNYLNQALGGWDDSKAGEVSQYALSRGYTPEELQSVFDPRFVHMAWEAAQYRKLQSAKPQVANKVKNVGPVIKPGSSDAKQSTQNSRVNDLRSKLKKTGDERYAVALLLERNKAARRR